MQVYGQKKSNQGLSTIFESTVEVRSQISSWTTFFNHQIRSLCKYYHEPLIRSNSKGQKFRIWDKLVHCMNWNKHMNTLFWSRHKYAHEPFISILLQISSWTPYLKKQSRSKNSECDTSLKGLIWTGVAQNAKQYNCCWM